MLESFSSNIITAKTKAMYGRRLTPQQYAELTHKRSVADIASYLQDNTHYRESLEGMQPSQVHRGQLENSLQKSRFRAYLRLMRYAPPQHQAFYNYLIVQFEVNMILQMIRLLGNGHPEDFVVQYPAYMERRASFSMMALARVRSFEELVELLRPTPYAEVLSPLRPLGGRSINYARCETALRRYFYRWLEETIDRCFQGETRRQLRDIFITAIEVGNITTIYRLKRFYPQMTADEISRNLIPSWRSLGRQESEKLLGTPTAEEFLRALGRSRLARYLGSPDPRTIEHAQVGAKYRLSRRSLRFATDAPTAFAAYMVLSEIEIQNLITIIEAVRYQLSASEMAELLVIS